MATDLNRLPNRRGLWLFLIIILGLGLLGKFASGPSGSGSTSSDVGGDTIRNQRSLCLHKETLDRAYKLVASGDKEAFVQFMQQQQMIGECGFTPRIGTKVRVEDRNWGLICIAPFGSSEPCRWTATEAVK